MDNIRFKVGDIVRLIDGGIVNGVIIKIKDGNIIYTYIHENIIYKSRLCYVVKWLNEKDIINHSLNRYYYLPKHIELDIKSIRNKKIIEVLN